MFHFLAPGFLGNKKQFKQNFQTPIEKDHHPEKREQLIKLLKPFVLRRTKQQVALDLPEKTEIIKTITFSDKQQDLYESIRLAMHKKVRAAITKKGLERSYIVILDALLKMRQVCCDPRLVKLPLAKTCQQSAKLDYLMQMLGSLLAEDRKILLFSQFTSMLALIEEKLTAQGIDYVKITGQTKDRKTPIAQFQAGKVPLFLISLKAGGTGLNLTAADTVIHYDPWWNPAVERQATDRAHRIGQKNPVFVYKLLVAGTVEEKILAMQRDKQGLIDSLFTDTSHTAKITKGDLDVLFS